MISNIAGDDAVVNRIKTRYNSVPDKCFDSNNTEKPAYECSGILIRGVRTDLKMDYAWGFKNSDQQKDAFSLAYLRSDQVFSRFPRGYDSGYIVYPHLETPLQKNKYKVFCSFPMDAHTDAREGHGCGKSRRDRIEGSKNCHKQNIKTFDTWKSHFDSIMNSGNKNFVVRQCGFDMTKRSAAAYFDVSLKANRHIQSSATKYAFRNNELRMHAWSVKEAKNIPIEAFFYLIGSENGKILAEKYQDTFFARSGGEKIPIVGVRLPTAQTTFDVVSHVRTPQTLERDDYYDIYKDYDTKFDNKNDYKDYF